MPVWAARLLGGEPPPTEDDGQDFHDFFGWLFCDEAVPGLPDPWSAEGCKFRQWRS
jgi:hypothetical protein